MEVLSGIDGLRRLPQNAVVSIGNFDGIHRGHTWILDMGRRLRAETGGQLCAVTFEPHPLTVLKPALAPPRLTPTGVKRTLLAEGGVDHLVELPPEPAVLNTTAEEFWRILCDEIAVSHLIEGASFNFGKGRGGNTRLLMQWAEGTPVRVHVAEAVEAALLDLSVVEVSSSLIRWLLAYGRARDAAICLGRPYILEGQVVRGYERGRTIGMPTANLDCGDQLIPADGVYAARCEIGGAVYPVALSIGSMPTFGQNRLQTEGHIIGFTGDLYGTTMRLELLDWLRDQRKFASVELLKAQMAKDLGDVTARVAMDPSRAVGCVAQ